MTILHRKNLKSCPYDQFEIWFDEAKSCEKIRLPEAFCLSTVSDDGCPDSRIVLLKEFSKNEGFVFYTNLNSQKGKQLFKNPKACGNFYWMPLDYQIRFSGKVKLVSEIQADAYFKTRPRLSQIGAWASNQSEELNSREVLENKFNEFEEKFKNSEVPRPKHWSGFCIKPDKIEFWKNQNNRLHDRFLYSQNENKWVVRRLNP